MVVTHEVGFAREVADRVVFMDDGMIVEAASPQTFFTDPKEERSNSSSAASSDRPPLSGDAGPSHPQGQGSVPQGADVVAVHFRERTEYQPRT
nr:hypothetical protein [Candidatus Synechococcus spongiarum]